MNVRVCILYYFMPDRENSIDRFADSSSRQLSHSFFPSLNESYSKKEKSVGKICEDREESQSGSDDRKQAYDSNDSWNVR